VFQVVLDVTVVFAFEIIGPAGEFQTTLTARRVDDLTEASKRRQLSRDLRKASGVDAYSPPGVRVRTST
jgi:hypothetical protein